MQNIKNEYEDHMRELNQYDNYFLKGLIIGFAAGVVIGFAIWL